jgi:hypothetical protein
VGVRIDSEDVRHHYASFADEELAALNPDDLTEAARAVYEAELARRGLPPRHEAEETEKGDDSSQSISPIEEFGNAISEFDDTGPPPDWLEDTVCACSFATHPRDIHLPMAGKARAILRRAGIPFYITMDQDEDNALQVPPAPRYSRHVGDSSALPQNAMIRVMVPGTLVLLATSVLDREIFNEEKETEWRNHFEGLSDEELRALDPEIFCAGYLDLVARLRRAYEDEVARRQLTPQDTGSRGAVAGG